MHYWLVKTEPQDYSYFDLEQQGEDVWDGVKNFAAQKNIQNMRPRDPVFVYHTGREKSIVGVAEATGMPYPDPGNPKLYVINLSPRYRLERPVTLHEIKNNPFFSEWELVRLPRLSVMTVSPQYWEMVHRMAAQVL